MFAMVACGKQMQEDPKLEAILLHGTFQEPVQPGLKTENLSKKLSSAFQLFQHFQRLFTGEQMQRVKETLRGTRSVKLSEMLCAFDTDSIASFSSMVVNVVSLGLVDHQAFMQAHLPTQLRRVSYSRLPAS